MAKFTVIPQPIPGVVLIKPTRWADQRGYFVEIYNARDLAIQGITCNFVQDNEALSLKKGTIRGLHFQVPPHSQAKLVRTVRGAVFDVAVDIRKRSPTYGRWCSAILTVEGGEQLLIPRGFAHGYCTLEHDAIVAYKVDDFYAADCDAGILWNDPQLGIDWPITAREAILSEKDAKLPPLSGFESPFLV